MNILMVAPQPFFRPRGTPFSVLHRIRALVRLGHHVELVTYPFGDTPDLPGVVIHRAARPPWVSDVGIGPSMAKLMLDAPLLALTYRLAMTGRFDLLHTHEEAGFAGAWIAGRAGLAHLYDMHSSLPEQFANFGRFNWAPVVGAFRRLERSTLRGADGVITICPELRDLVLRRGYDGPLALIENTLDFDPPAITGSDVDALRDRLGLRDSLVVVYTGTLEAYQGLDLLLASAGMVREKVSRARFLIVGGTPEQVEQLRFDARARGVETLFTFVPAVPPTEVFLYLRAADALVTCRARGTNTPLKLYQYLRAERPIVATAIRSHTQVLTPESSELVAPTPEAIAQGLIRVLTDPAHARELAAGAGRLAREEYSEAAYLQRLADVLDRTSKAHRDARAA